MKKHKESIDKEPSIYDVADLLLELVKEGLLYIEVDGQGVAVRKVGVFDDVNIVLSTEPCDCCKE